MRRKKKKYFVSLGCQVEPDMFSRVKLAALVMKVSRSTIIREGITLRLREIDEANNAMSEEFMNGPKK